jgi:hypothetical protein
MPVNYSVPQSPPAPPASVWHAHAHTILHHTLYLSLYITPCPLSYQDTFFTRSEVCLLVATMSDALGAVDLPAPAIMKPMELWTGKQVGGCVCVCGGGGF